MVKKVVSLNPGMTPRSFEKSVRDRAAFPHMIGFTNHAVDRMQERGITRTMVLRILRRGTVDGPRIKRDRTNDNWTAPIMGIAAGMEIRVVCAIGDESPFLTIITAYGG